MKKIAIAIVGLSMLLLSCKQVERNEITPSAKSNKSQLQVDNASEDKEKWDTDLGKCVTVTENTCCAKPPTPTPPPVPAGMITIYNKFLNAFNGDSIPQFFLNEDYTSLWPDLASETTLISGLTSGTNRVIKLTNAGNGYDYFLIGNYSSSDSEIEANPIYVVYVNW